MPFGGGSSPPVPPPPPPPPNPPTAASGQVAQSGDLAQRAARAAAGAGMDDTIKTSAQGAPDPNKATKTLLGT